MKYGEIYSLYDALNRMRDVTGFKVAWAVAKNIKILETAAQFFEDRRLMMIKEYGEEKDGKISLNRDNPKFPDFVEKLTELSEKETDIELYTISDVTEADFHSDTARANDFLLFMQWIVKEGDGNAS